MNIYSIFVGLKIRNMAVNFSFFKIPEHKVFHYEPRFYDPRKEHRDEVAREAKREKAMKEGVELKDDTYVPGKMLHGKFREMAEQNRRQPFKPTTMRLVSYISLAIFFIFMFFFGDMFVELIQALNR